MIVKYIDQVKTWPETGKHILAKYDQHAISVYQAYNPDIAKFAVEQQRFGGSFSYSRMSWVKPNFLWMMYRSGWASKEGQERILEIKIPRAFFEEILKCAVKSTFDPSQYSTSNEWKSALEKSEVRLQWDPDHDPFGKPLNRKALQLGLRGAMLETYGKEKIVEILDITDFVFTQKRT